MSEDILHRIKIADQDPNFDFSAQMYNEALIKIEDICILISNMPLIHFGMPSPNRPAAGIINSYVQREQQFVRPLWLLLLQIISNCSLLNKRIYV